VAAEKKQLLYLPIINIGIEEKQMVGRDKIHIGCSGWNYQHWRGRFYPKEQPSNKWFEFYAQVFDTVEINNTFYRLPEARIFKAWRKQAPDDFLYTVKASRFLTHQKKLKDARAPLKKFIDRAKYLEEHLGPILYQLPSRWHLNRERLESFIDLLPDNLIHVFEFRDQSWMVEETFRLLQERGVFFCTHDMSGLKVPRLAMGEVAYVRLHGTGKKYQGGYREPMLRSWWNWMKNQVRGGSDLFVYFNNDVEAHAVRDAQRLMKKAGLK
jgi:uncharacterized protein YecE (DUF72 family)